MGTEKAESLTIYWFS